MRAVRLKAPGAECGSQLARIRGNHRVRDSFGGNNGLEVLVWTRCTVYSRVRFVASRVCSRSLDRTPAHADQAADALRSRRTKYRHGGHGKEEWDVLCRIGR